MKKLTKLILTIILLISFSFADGLVLCIYPSKSNKLLYEQYKPLLKHLEKELKQKVHFTIARDYNNVIELLLSNKAQIAIMGPYNYIKAKKEDGNIQYIATQQYLKNNKMVSSYQAIIVASKISGIESINELKGKRFGFTDFNSTSGYLLPNLILTQQNISKNDFSEHFMLKRHTHIMEALTRNSIDAGATHLGNYLDYLKKYGNQYKVLYTSESIPYDAIVVSSYITAQLALKIEKAFLSYKEIVNNEEVSGYIKQDESVYDVIKLKAVELQ